MKVLNPIADTLRLKETKQTNMEAEHHLFYAENIIVIFERGYRVFKIAVLNSWHHSLTCILRKPH